MKEKSKGFLPIAIIFILLNGFFLMAKSMLEDWGVDKDVLSLGNTLIFLITLVSYFIAVKGLNNPNPNVFVRTVMASIMVKMFLLVIAAFIYISMYRGNINKPALFTCMGLYLVYTILEVNGLMKMLKSKSNG